MTIVSSSYHWDNSTAAGYQASSGTWGTDNFWSQDGTTLVAWPGAGHDAIFGGTDGSYTITVNGNQAVDNIIFDNSGYTLNNGTVTLNGFSKILVASGKTATINSVIAGNNGATFEGPGTLTLNGANTFTGNTSIKGGTLVVNNNSSLGNNAVNINGGVLSLGNGITIGNTFTINSINAGTGKGAIQEPASGSATLSGTININNNSISGGHFSGGNSTDGLKITGPINAAAGINVTNEAYTTTFSGGGTYYSFRISKDNVYLGAHDGISTAAIIDIGNSGAAVLDLKGYNQTVAGLIRSSNNSATVTNTSGTQSVLTLNVSESSSYPGIIQGNIALVKSGSGTQILSGTNTYSGTTTISVGDLRINGSISSATTVQTDATLSGNGTVSGTVTVNNGGILTPGNVGAGKLTVGGLILNPSSILNYELGTNSDTIANTGNLTLDGTINVSALAGFTYGTYTIMTYAGTITNNGLTVGSLPPGYTANVSAAAGVVILTIKANQTITFNALPGKIYGDTDFDPVATASSGLPVSYTSSDESVATIVDGKIHIVGAGTSTITALQEGNVNYNAAEDVTQTLTVNKSNQTITFGALPGEKYGDDDFDPGATASSGLPVSYVSSDPSVATIVDGKIHITGAGAATITASQAGNANFNAAVDVAQILNVNKADQIITFGELPVKQFGDGDFDPGATVSSGLPVSYASSDESVATIVDGKIHIVSVGTSNITASQAGNENFNAAADVAQILNVNKADQIITFEELPVKQIGDEDFDPAATASSGLPVSYTSSNPLVATIVDDKIHIVGAGTSTITASQAGDSHYNAAVNAIQTLTVNKLSQTITFDLLPAKQFGDDDFDPAATASSGLPVSYTSSDESVATIINGKIHIVGAGTSTITASQAGNENYNAADNVIQLLNVDKADQVITFAALPVKQFGDTDFDPSATASSGLPVSYTSSEPSVATIVDGKIHIVGAGTATITVSQAGNANYNAAVNVDQTLTVNKANQTITFGALPVKQFGDADFDPAATASSGLLVSYTSSEPSVATIVDGKIHIVGVGTSTITAFQAGGANYNAAVDVTQLLSVNKADQVITFDPLPLKQFGDADFDPGATTSSGLPVSYTSSDESVATIVDNKIHIAGAGTSTITASQAGNANFNAAANVAQLLSVNKADQVITFGPLPVKQIGDGDFDPGATASSGLPVSYESSDLSVATIVAGKIHIVGAGTSTITASQTGNENFNAAVNVTQVLTVNKLSQTITFNALPVKQFGDEDFDPEATASSGLPVSYTSSDPSVATIVAGKIHIVGAGTSTITASQAGNNNFNAADDMTQLLSVNKVDQAITFGALPVKLFDDDDFDPGATASSGLPVSYTSSDPSVATIVAGKIHIVGIGTSIITASQAGNANYNAAVNVDQTLTVNKSNQIITFDPLPAKQFGDADFDPGAITSSGLPVSYTSSNPLVATIDDNKIHIVGVGTSTITALQAGNANFNAAEDVTQLLTVNKADQIITFNALPVKQFGDEDFDPGATASSGLPVSYTSSNLSVATIVDNKIHIIGVGTSTITASQAGDANYNAAVNATQVLTVDKISQTITFGPLPVKQFGDADFDPGATASSGLPVSYTSSDESVAMIVNGNIHIVSAGTSTITASQAGDANYNAAVSVNQTLTVNKLNQTITFNMLSIKQFGDADFDPGATVSSGLPVSYTSSDESVATIVNGKIHIAGAGTSTITASQAGNANFNAAISVDQTLTVNKSNQTITFGPLPAKQFDDVDFDPGATASSGLSVSYTSSDPSVATIVGGKIHIVGIGTSTITASQAGNANFNAAASVDQTLTVNKSNQTIIFGPLPAKQFDDVDFDPGATASSGLPIIYTSSDPSVATIVEGKIHIVGVGTSTITASQAGNANYNAANDVTQLLSVNKADQVITFGALLVKQIGDVDFDPGATASSGLPVAYTSSDESVVTIVNGKIHIVGAGTSTITASQAGDAHYNAAVNVTQALIVNKLTQTISFDPLSVKQIGDVDFDPKAIASSGLPVTYTSSDESVATIINGKIHIVGAGTSIITASQVGDAHYSAAVDAAQTLTVNKLTQTITFGALAVKQFGDADFNPGATASSGLPVSYTSSDTLVAIIIAGQIHIVGAGTSVITASQIGDATYNAAPEMSQTLTINKAVQTITFDTLATKIYGDTAFSPNAISSSSLDIVYTSSDTTVAKIIDGKIHIMGAGSAIITASQNGNSNYDVSPEVEQNLTVNKKALIVSADNKTRLYGKTNPVLTWTFSGFVNGEDSTVLDVKPSITTDATINSPVGTYPIVLNGGNDNNYTYSFVNGILSVIKDSQTITFSPLSNHTILESFFRLSAVCSSGLPVSFISLDISKVRISNDSAFIIDTGCVSILAYQIGDVNYDSAHSVSQNVCIIPVQLDPPVLIVNSSERINQILNPTLKWHSVVHASDYRFQLSLNSTFSETIIDTILTDTIISLNGLYREKIYFWRVAAHNHYSTSAFSVDSFQTIPNIPSVPVLIVSDSERINQMLTKTLSWYKVPNATMYKIELSKDISFSKVVYSDTLIDTTIVVDSLELNNTYYWHVASINPGGSSAFCSPDSFKTISVLLATPVILTIIPDSMRVGTTITLDWENVTNATYYGLEISTDSSFSKSETKFVSADSSFVIIFNLKNNTKYFWRVDARSANGKSNWSTVEHFTTMPSANDVMQSATAMITSNTTSIDTDITIISDATNSVRGEVITIVRNPIFEIAKLINVSYPMSFSKSSNTIFNKPIAISYSIPPTTLEGKALDSAMKKNVRPYFIDDLNRVSFIYNMEYDKNGNIVIYTDSLKKIFFAIDTIAPILIDNTSNAPKDNGTVPVLSGSAIDNILNTRYYVHFRKGGLSKFDSLPFTTNNDNSFKVSLGANLALDSNGFEYYFSAFDGVNNIKLERQNISAILEKRSDNSALPVMKWHLVSSPMQLQYDSITSIFGSLGEYAKKWRMYYFQSKPVDTLIEFNKGLSIIEPGKAYWIKTRKENISVSVPSGITIPVNKCFSIQIPARNWIAISNPFMFAVSWKSVLDSSFTTNASLIGPYTYQDSVWILPDKINKLIPWQGYYLFNNSDTVINLRIPSLAYSEQGQLPKMTAHPDLFKMELIVKGPNGSDYNNFFGFSQNCSDDFDPSFDFPKPASPQEDVKTYFSRPTLAKISSHFQTDFTSLKDGGAIWHININNMQHNKPYFCHIDNIDALPDSLEAWIIDLSSGTKWNIRAGDYGVAASKEYPSVSLKLVIGTSSYIHKMTGNLKLVPMEFFVSKNYPNPVRNITRINYTIPYNVSKLHVPVNLSIYTMSGRKVTTILEQSKPAGYYTIYVDISKYSLASGTYIYRLTAGKHWKSQIMQVVK